MDKVRRKSSKASPKKEKKEKEKKNKKKDKKESDRLTESSVEEAPIVANPLHQSGSKDKPKDAPQPQGVYSGVYTRTFPVKSAYAPLSKDAKKEKKWVTKCCKTSKPGLMWMACYVVAYYLFKVCQWLCFAPR